LSYFWRKAFKEERARNDGSPGGRRLFQWPDYDFLEQRKVTGWIPVFGKYRPEIEGFPYNREKDEYSCPMNRPLPLKGFYANRDGSVLKRYWTALKDCKVCPMKSQCVPNSKCKKITGTVYDEQYLRAYARQRSEKGKRMKKLGQSTVEPVFGSSAQFYGLRKIGVLGKAGAHKVMPVAAIAFNLKKYLKKGGRRPSIGIFRTIMDAFRGCPAIFLRQIQPRPVLQKAP